MLMSFVSCSQEKGQISEGTSKQEEKQESTIEKKDEKESVDLTKLSSTMVFSEVSHMMMKPEDYVGRTVKMKGTCALYIDEEAMKEHYACLIKDAMQCCSQGIEFELKDREYPKKDEKITVVGVFDTYKDGGFTNCYLKEARLE